MKKSHWLGALILCSLAIVFVCGMGSARGGGPHSIPGTFLLTVTPQEGADFKEMLVLHRDGAISETNTVLHANSGSGPLGVNGSTGYGAWERRPPDRVAFRFVKLVFDGATDEHIGYLLVEGVGEVLNDQFMSEDAVVTMLIGVDFDNPVEVIPLGTTDSVGHRIAAD